MIPRRNPILLAVLAIASLAPTAHALADGQGDPFGEPARELPLTEAMIDAARTFEKVDVDRNGLVDQDEYAAQRVVRAQLARFNGRVAIDGRGVTHVAVPESVAGPLSPGEQAALDAVTRREFHLRNPDGGGLDRAAWQEARLEPFTLADEDGDGVLKGSELAVYARLVAGDLSASLPGT